MEYVLADAVEVASLGGNQGEITPMFVGIWGPYNCSNVSTKNWNFQVDAMKSTRAKPGMI